MSTECISLLSEPLSKHFVSSSNVLPSNRIESNQIPNNRDSIHSPVSAAFSPLLPLEKCISSFRQSLEFREIPLAWVEAVGVLHAAQEGIGVVVLLNRIHSVRGSSDDGVEHRPEGFLRGFDAVAVATTHFVL